MYYVKARSYQCNCEMYCKEKKNREDQRPSIMYSH